MIWRKIKNFFRPCFWKILVFLYFIIINPTISKELWVPILRYHIIFGYWELHEVLVELLVNLSFYYLLSCIIGGLIGKIVEKLPVAYTKPIKKFLTPTIGKLTVFIFIVSLFFVSYISLVSLISDFYATERITEILKELYENKVITKEYYKPYFPNWLSLYTLQNYNFVVIYYILSPFVDIDSLLKGRNLHNQLLLPFYWYFLSCVIAELTKRLKLG